MSVLSFNCMDWLLFQNYYYCTNKTSVGTVKQSTFLFFLIMLMIARLYTFYSKDTPKQRLTDWAAWCHNTHKCCYKNKLFRFYIKIFIFLHFRKCQDASSWLSKLFEVWYERESRQKPIEKITKNFSVQGDSKTPVHNQRKGLSSWI